MKKFEHLDTIISLLKKELSGSINENEKKALNLWKEDSRIKALIDKYDDEGYLDSKFAELSKHDVKIAFKKFYAKIHKPGFSITIYKLAKIAAVIIIPLMIGAYLIRDFYANHDSLLSETLQIKPGKSLVELVLNDGKIIRMGIRTDTIIEQNGALIRSGSKNIIYDTKEKILKTAYHTARIPRGGEFSITLNDGTKVWLNSESELKYPIPFPSNKREVVLKNGEAYFEVAHNKSKPFFVRTSEGLVRVLGTSFNVKAYKEDVEIYTTLVEGKISFSSLIENGEKVNIEPGFQAVLKKGQPKVQVAKVDTRLYTGWKDGLFSFKNESLESIMTTLARWYDIDVFYEDDEVKKILFTGDLERYESINPFLEMLQKSGKAKFKIIERAVIVNIKK